MTWEMWFVFALLAATIAVFVWDRFRMDFVALAVMAVLAVSGIVTPAEAVAGFGSSVVLMIAGLFVVGEALLKTGIAAAAGHWLIRVGQGSTTRLLLILLPVVALLSAFMSSTGTVSLLIPVVLVMVREANLSAGRLMMPLAFASLIGGMLTLIGTPPNIIVSEALSKAGLEPFSFFDFTPIGLVMLAVGMTYMLTVGQWLLPSASHPSEVRDSVSLARLARHYNLERRLFYMRLLPGSPLIGKTVSEARLRRDFAATLFGVERRRRWLSSVFPVLSNTIIQPGDRLWFYIEPEHAQQLTDAMRLWSERVSVRENLRLQQSFGYAEVLVPPGSALAGKTLLEGRFRETHGLSVIGVRRDGEIVALDFNQTRLAAGDALLLAGGWEDIRRLGQVPELLVFNTPVELQEVAPRRNRAPQALMIMLGLLVAMASGWLPNLTAILLAAVLLIASRCVTLDEAYRSLNAVGLVLIAGMLPMATAMEKSGALAFVVGHIVDIFASAGPLALSALFFLLTSFLSQFISNTATSVLMAPVAIKTALGLGYAPEPILMAVAIAASTAFATPIASPVNTLVLAPGNYRFKDFTRVGLGLQVLIMMAALAVIPYFFPY